MIKGINTSKTAKDTDTDVIGGGFLWDTGIYPVQVLLAYLDVSRNGAKCINFIFKRVSDSKELRHTIYITNRNGDNFYVRENVEHLLPGWLQVKSIYEIATGTSFDKANTQEKAVNIYDYDTKKESPQNREVLVDILNKPLVIGVHRMTVDKNVKNDSGEYVPSGEVRDVNEVNKAFHTTGLTVAEKTEGITEPVFLNKWKATWGNKVINKSKGASGSATKTADSNEQKTQSLF